MAIVHEFGSQIWKKKMIQNRHDFVSHQAGGCLRRSKAGSGCGSLSMLARRTWANILENINKYCPVIWTNTSWIWLCFQIKWELGPVWNWFGRDNPTGISHGWQSISNNLSFSYNLAWFWVFTSYSFFFILQKTAFSLVKSRLALGLLGCSVGCVSPYQKWPNIQEKRCWLRPSDHIQTKQYQIRTDFHHHNDRSQGRKEELVICMVDNGSCFSLSYHHLLPRVVRVGGISRESELV